MHFADPSDPSPVAQTATENFWFKHSPFLNVETRYMATAEYPQTDNSRWLHENLKIDNRGSLEDMVLQDTDHITWPAHLSTPVGKTLVITGRNEERKFTLEELLHRLDSFMETSLSRRRASINFGHHRNIS